MAILIPVSASASSLCYSCYCHLFHDFVHERVHVLDNLCFMDKARFHWSGFMNIHNSRIEDGNCMSWYLFLWERKCTGQEKKGGDNLCWLQKNLKMCGCSWNTGMPGTVPCPTPVLRGLSENFICFLKTLGLSKNWKVQIQYCTVFQSVLEENGIRINMLNLIAKD